MDRWISQSTGRRMCTSLFFSRCWPMIDFLPTNLFNLPPHGCLAFKSYHWTNLALVQWIWIAWWLRWVFQYFHCGMWTSSTSRGLKIMIYPTTYRIWFSGNQPLQSRRIEMKNVYEIALWNEPSPKGCKSDPLIIDYQIRLQAFYLSHLDLFWCPYNRALQPKL